MTARYTDEMMEVAIKYAGHEMLNDAACDSFFSAVPSDVFNRRIGIINGRQTRKRRVKKTLRVLCKVAAVVMVFLVVSTAVIFSSEALRTQVSNLLISMQGGTINITNYSSNEALPEGIIMPRYLPDGFELVEAKEQGGEFNSRFENAVGDFIDIRQYTMDGSIDIGVDPSVSYQTTISGREAIVTDVEGFKQIIFNNESYCFFVRSEKVEISELQMLAESILTK